MLASMVLLVSHTFGGVVAHETPTDTRVYAMRRELGWCGPKPGHLPGLDDSDCAKRFPDYFDRDYVCPVVYNNEQPRGHGSGGFGPPADTLADIAIDEEELASILPENVTVAITIVRRGGNVSAPYQVRYIGRNARKPRQPWSSSKVFAAARAAMRARELSGGLVGLDSRENGKNLQLGDLVTVITSYDTTHNLTSNALGAYFHAFGGHKLADSFIHSGLGAPADESFGGNYGESPPPALGYKLSAPGAASSPFSEPFWPDPTPNPPIPNSMSSLTMAEFLRRSVLTREKSAVPVLNNYTDAASILYGANSSTLFPGLQWGGMSMSSDVYVQRALNITAESPKGGTPEAKSHGRWRIFSKLGAGFSDTRDRFEIGLNAYVCLPVLRPLSGARMEPVPQRGLEFFLSASVHDANISGRGADEAMQGVIDTVVNHLLLNYY